jgi:hypothetical protein
MFLEKVHSKSRDEKVKYIYRLLLHVHTFVVTFTYCNMFDLHLFMLMNHNLYVQTECCQYREEILKL